jgi:hypothetical protein
MITDELSISLGTSCPFWALTHMWNGAWQGLFAESSAADGAVLCPAYECGQMTADHDEFRETNRPINFARSEAP